MEPTLALEALEAEVLFVFGVGNHAVCNLE